MFVVQSNIICRGVLLAISVFVVTFIFPFRFDFAYRHPFLHYLSSYRSPLRKSKSLCACNMAARGEIGVVCLLVYIHQGRHPLKILQIATQLQA